MAKEDSAKKKENFFERTAKRTSRYFRELKSELKKIVWPTRKQTTSNALIAIGIILASSVVIWGFDTLAGLGVQKLISIAAG